MGGVRKRPIYKIVVADGRYPRDGKFIEKIGSYNPLLPKDKKERIKIICLYIKYQIEVRLKLQIIARVVYSISEGQEFKTTSTPCHKFNNYKNVGDVAAVEVASTAA